MPPPYPIIHKNGELMVPDFEKSKMELASLLNRLSIDIKPRSVVFKKLPYDLYCPSLQKVLKDRVCTECCLYFASKKGVAAHEKALHRKQRSVPKTKINKVVTKIKKEVLCVTEQSPDQATWLDEDEISIEMFKELDTTNASHEQSIVLIENLEDWLVSPWTEENV